MRPFEELGIEQRSSVTREMIERVEERLGCQFPDAYKKLVLYAQEPVPEVSVFTYEGGESCVSEFLQFTDDESETFGILNHKPTAMGLPGNTIPIARDAGDFLICLTLTGGRDSVVLFDPNEKVLVQIADSFEEFMDSLSEG